MFVDVISLHLCVQFSIQKIIDLLLLLRFYFYIPRTHMFCCFCFYYWIYFYSSDVILYFVIS